jgi:hypothetical protein
LASINDKQGYHTPEWEQIGIFGSLIPETKILLGEITEGDHQNSGEQFGYGRIKVQFFHKDF